MIDVDGERDVIKRVIGKAGDSIEIKNGAVYRNGVLISEEYAKDATEGEVSLTVPKGGIFVLGTFDVSGNAAITKNTKINSNN